MIIVCIRIKRLQRGRDISVEQEDEFSTTINLLCKLAGANGIGGAL